MHIGSLCSLRLTPSTQGVRIIINCGGQCTVASSFQNRYCAELIQRCNQAECNQRLYNLSTCISAETGIIITDTPIQTNIRDAVTTEMTIEQTQESIPTTVKTTNKNVQVNSNQTVAALATTVALLIVLLVIVSIALIWTCWTFKIKEAMRFKFQHR